MITSQSRGLNYGLWRTVAASLLVVAAASGLAPQSAHAQMPSALYTWDAASNIQQWAKNFGTNTVTLSNSIPGELTIVETGTAGTGIAISDNGNKVRESSLNAGGGTDLTGLEYLEFDLGHTGAGPINVQFFIQGSTGYTYKALGPDVPVLPGMNTYQVPLSGLTPEEQVYLRTMGFNARDHVALGNVTWTLREVRSAGTPLAVRDLITHNTGVAEGGLQGVIVNFDGAAVLGNTGQNQTGLSHNPAGSGSLRWTDIGGGPGAAISWGNGTAWNGNTFNNRTTDLSGYTEMIVRMSATGTPGEGETSIGVQGFFQRDNFAFQAAEGGAGKQLPIDGQFHDLTYSLAGLTNMNVVDQTGINVFGHATDLELNVDNIRFRRLVGETLFSWENSFEGWIQGPEAGHVHSIVSTGATHGTTALQIDRTSVPGNPPPADTFVLGSSFTTTNPTQINHLVSRINNAEKIALDVTYTDQLLPQQPTYSNFTIILTDNTGAQYQATTSSFDINGADNETLALEIPLADFDDVAPGSTKNLAVDGLSPTTTTLSIAIGSGTDGGAVYQIDNFRVMTLDEAVSIPGDFNGDQVVNAGDLAEWRTSFAEDAGADADEDGDTDGNDFLIWQRQLGVGSQTAVAAAVPEPAAWALGLLAALATWRRRR